MRRTPSSASSATVGPVGRASTFTGRSTDDTTEPDVGRLGQPRGEEDVGAGLLVRLEPGDGVGQVGPARMKFSARAVSTMRVGPRWATVAAAPPLGGELQVV